MALARAVKGGGGHIWLGLAEGVDSVRPYPRLDDLWRMVSRSAYAQVRHNPLLLTGTVAGLALVYLVPPVALVVGTATGRTAAVFLGGARLVGDGRDVRPDAPLLPAAAVARSPAAVHRVPLSPHDGRFSGAALPGARRGLEGPHLRRPDTVVGDES